MSKKQEDIQSEMQQKYMEMQILNQHMKQLQEQIQQIDMQAQELERIQQGVQELKQAKKDQDILIPVSPGIFMKCAIKDAKELIVNVGANVMVGKSVDEAVAFVTNRNNEVSQVRTHFANELTKLTQQAQKIEQEVMKLSQQMQS